jgi:hypothetical protein
MAAGFMAGITEALVIVTPFEVGEEQMSHKQQHMPGTGFGADSHVCLCRVVPPNYTSVAANSCIIQVVKIRLQQQRGLAKDQMKYKVRGMTRLCRADHQPDMSGESARGLT